MPNTITVSFTACEPIPDGGYDIFYRPEFSTIPYRYGGNFTASPAVITDTNGDAPDTFYEGYIHSICNGLPGSDEYFGYENLIQGTVTKDIAPNRFHFALNQPFPCTQTIQISIHQLAAGDTWAAALIAMGLVNFTLPATDPLDTDPVTCMKGSKNGVIVPGSDLIILDDITGGVPNIIDCSGTLWRLRLTIIGGVVCP